jgi:hypothetical protein
MAIKKKFENIVTKTIVMFMLGTMPTYDQRLTSNPSCEKRLEMYMGTMPTNGQRLKSILRKLESVNVYYNDAHL